MSIFDFDDYRAFAKARIEASGKYGQYTKLAAALEMHSTSVSQVFGGRKDLSAEQACRLAQYLSLSELETEYLLGLVERERAGSALLKKTITRRLAGLRHASLQLSARLKNEKSSRLEVQGIFYSHWYYSALSLACEIKGLESVDALAAYFSLPRNLVSDAADFLVREGFCRWEGARLRPGTSITHLSQDSPFVSQHHANWRRKAEERGVRMNAEEELRYSAPVTLSREDAVKIRKLLLQVIEDFLKTVHPSPSQVVYCLNIDWLQVR